jgi:thermitase
MQDRRVRTTVPATWRMMWTAGVMLGALLALFPALVDAAPGAEYVASEVLVVLGPGICSETLDNLFGTQTAEEIEGIGIARVLLPGYSSDANVIGQMREFGGILYVEKNYVLETPEADQSSMPFIENEPSMENYLEQRAADQLGLEEAHEISTGEGVRVAILDTGADLDHWLLAGHLSPIGYDLVGGDPEPSEEPDGFDNDFDGYIDESLGHGSHVAGTVALVAPGCEILIYRVLDAEGRGSLFNLAQGIVMAANDGAQIINLSLGLHTGSVVLQEALSYARNAGCLIICASGNTMTSDPEYMPAASPQTCAVAATDTADIRAPFSNYGSFASLAAPGVEIYSAYSNDLCARWSGTSMAAPLVSGVAALVWAHYPELGPVDVIGIVLDAAVDIDALNPQVAGLLGAGRLDAAQALAAP